MQEVSGSIPLGSTNFAETEAVRGTAFGEIPERKRGVLWVEDQPRTALFWLRRNLKIRPTVVTGHGLDHIAVRNGADGALAQLGERLHGMQEVSGSIPLGSTIQLKSK